VSCEGLLDPKPVEELSSEDILMHANLGGGMLGKAYTNLNTNFNVHMDYYTDNAVPSEVGSNVIALGGWTLQNNPIGEWAKSYNSLQYINQFLNVVGDLTYRVGEVYRDSLERSLRTGEAYFLRAWYQWELLQAYGGYVEGDTEAKGFPIVKSFSPSGTDLSKFERGSYASCVEQIISDCDEAIARLPLYYVGSNEFTGIRNKGRASAEAAMALKARVYLYAASPAFSIGINGLTSQQLWEKAAKAAYDAIMLRGGLSDLQPYENFSDASQTDRIWIQPTWTGNSPEQSYYPPSLFGQGQCNPSQNLVNAFPAVDGYPIENSPLFSQTHPYNNRDPRLNRFIFYNGEIYNNQEIEIFQGGKDAPGGLSLQGTRTGYYLQKHLSSAVRLTPGNTTTATKFKTYLGRTELYLNFAEAANEAYGPNDLTLGLSASDALKKVRKRAGIDSDPLTQGYQDEYLEAVSGYGKDQFRDLVRNERRIELCFEGHRFWDIRRWNLPLNHVITGVAVTKDGNNFNYQSIEVEEHQYEDYMRYVPIPYYETLLLTSVKQNRGW
jgi:hypothetical protein